jgi:hypothetical protein
VLTDFIDLFDSHHNVAKNFKATKDVQWEEFVEFYTAISSTIANEKEFEILITCVWSLDLADTKEGPIAGKKTVIDLKDSKAAFKYDMHRSLFGKLDNSPYKHQSKDADVQPLAPSKAAQPPAGGGAWTDIRRKGLSSEISCLSSFTPEKGSGGSE